MPVTFARVPSPVGELVLAATDSGITGVYFPTSRHGPAPLERQDWVEDDGRSPASALLAQARRQLEEYFAGARTTFDLPLSPAGTLFQRRVRSEEHTSELQSQSNLVCRLLLEKKKRIDSP